MLHQEMPMQQYLLYLLLEIIYTALWLIEWKSVYQTNYIITYIIWKTTQSTTNHKSEVLATEFIAKLAMEQGKTELTVLHSRSN